MDLVTPESIGISTRRLQRVRAALAQQISQQKLAGMLALVARYGKVAFFEEFGMANIEAGLPMQLDTIFRLYSMTKPVTAVAVMMLFEESRLRLTDPLSEFVPAFKEMKVLQKGSAGEDIYVEANRSITIHDLLVHTAGLSYGFNEDALDALYREHVYAVIETNPNLTLEELAAEIARLPLAHQPGSSFRYSFAFDILGLIVQIISGKPLGHFFQERIFEPLGMVDTDFWVPPDKAARLATLYNTSEQMQLAPAQSQGLFFIPHDKLPRCPFGGGGLFSTASDYFRFAQMLLNQGRLDSERILSRKTIELMTANHLPEGCFPFEDETTGSGLGLYVQTKIDRARLLGSLGSFGGGGAANTFFWIDPLEGLVQIFLTQYLGATPLPVSNDFNNLVYQALDD